MLNIHRKPMCEQSLRELSISKLLKIAEIERVHKEFIWEKFDGKYMPKTYLEFAYDVNALAKFLLSNNLQGQQVVVFGDNSYNFLVAETAIMGYVGVSVALNSAWQHKDCARAMGILNVKAFFYDKQREEIVDKLKAEYPDVEFFRLEDIIELKKKTDKQQKLIGQDTTKMVKIIFSSGTTSEPKAVMLSQRNMFSGFNGFLRRTKVTDNEIVYLFLPVGHAYGEIINFIYGLICGWQIYISSGREHILDELKEVKPTSFCVVPLVLESIYFKIDNASRLKINRAIRVSNFLLNYKIDIRKLIFSKLHKVFGGRLRYLGCAGAKLNSEIKQLFQDMGIKLIEAYGSTETSVALSMEYPNSPLLSVGVVYEEFEIKIDKPDKDGIGEILVKGDNVCLGYYKNQDANKLAFCDDGFFRTGDLGFINELNEVFINGRKKRFILRSDGVNVYPDEIERDLCVNGVKKVKVYEKNQKIIAEFYTNGLVDVDSIVKKYNEESQEFWKIDNYSISMFDAKNQMK